MEEDCLNSKQNFDETDEDVKDEASSSNEKKKEKEDRKESSDEEMSTDDDCVICLQKITNKSYASICFHYFCFNCLVEWAKQRPECPLCNRRFRSIFYNVRSYSEYDQYFIKKSERLSAYGNNRQSHYSTTLTPERISQTRRHVDYSERMIESEIASHQMRDAPYSVHPDVSISNPIPSTSTFRGLSTPNLNLEESNEVGVYNENDERQPPEGSNEICEPELINLCSDDEI